MHDAIVLNYTFGIGLRALHPPSNSLLQLIAWCMLAYLSGVACTLS
jgi:hypothetical protein